MKWMIISTKALESHTVFVSKLFEVMFSLENFTDAQRYLIVQVDITRCVVNEDGSTRILLSCGFATLRMHKTSRGLTNVLINRDAITWGDVISFDSHFAFGTHSDPL